MVNDEIVIIELYIWAWILVIIGIGFLCVLILYTKYSTEVSMKLYIITIVFSSISLGFGVHLFLTNLGV